MEIEVGKAYRTRSGLKANVQADHGCGYGLCRFSGLVDGLATSWGAGGQWAATKMDLIAEWQEPEPELKYKVGDIVKYQNGFKGIIVHKTDIPDGLISLPFDEDGCVESSGWYHELTGVRTGSDPQDDWTIIGPWIDPPKPLEFWANVYRDNGLLTCVGNLHLTKEAAEKVSKDAIRTSLFREVL